MRMDRASEAHDCIKAHLDELDIKRNKLLPELNSSFCKTASFLVCVNWHDQQVKRVICVCSKHSLLCEFSFARESHQSIYCVY